MEKQNPSLAEAVSGWLTELAQRGRQSSEIERASSIIWEVIDYFSGKAGRHPTVEEIIAPHYSFYEEMAADTERNVKKINILFGVINSFTDYVSREYGIPGYLLPTIKEQQRRRKLIGPSRHHYRLIIVLKRMVRKQKRGVVGALLERHRELKEVDDALRDAWDW